MATSRARHRMGAMSRTAAEPRQALEPLEARIVLAAPTDLAFIGLNLTDDGYQPFAQELVWDAERRVAGDLFTPGDGGPANPAPVEPFSLINAPSGSLRYIEDGAPWDPDAALASRFDDPGSYPFGWFLSESEDGNEATFGALLARSTDAAPTDLIGLWTVQFTQIIGEQVITRAGTISFTSAGGFFALATGSPGDPIFAGQAFEYLGEPEQGRFLIRMVDGDTGLIYLNADKSAIAFVDLDNAGSDTWMGVGHRADSDLDAADVAGAYRAGILYESDRISSAFDDRLGAAYGLSLSPDGSFNAYDLADFDRGRSVSPVLTGTWALNGPAVVVTDTQSGFQMTISLSDNGATGIVTGLRNSSSVAFERPLGLVTRVATATPDPIDASVFAAHFGPDGHALVYDLRQPDDLWSVVDLQRYATPDPAFPDSLIGESPIDIEVFEASDGRLIAVVNTADHLLAFERDPAGFWHTLDLTRGIQGAEPITSTLTVFTDRPGVAYVAGLTADGDVVTYTFDPKTDGGAWDYDNISQGHLTPKGVDTPVFVGPIMSFVTPWNALNIAGLDAEGNVQAVWTGNGGAEWHANNLTEITNAQPLASGLTAFVTQWNAINIVGLDADGNVMASWWVPEFGGNWALSDLTEITAGPTLTGDSVTSFVSPWGALNIAGLDNNGDLVAYWWTPALHDAGETWQVANLTADLDDDQPRPASALMGSTNLTFGGELNVIGADAGTGELLRLYFRVQDDAWALESLAERAEFA